MSRTANFARELAIPAGGLQSHGLHSAALQPVSQLMKIGGDALKPAHPLWIAIWPQRRIMCTIAHIDSPGVWMDYLQPRIFPLQAPSQFLPCFAISATAFIRRHPSSPWWKWAST
jgi:hypothetical protein